MKMKSKRTDPFQAVSPSHLAMMISFIIAAVFFIQIKLFDPIIGMFLIGGAIFFTFMSWKDSMAGDNDVDTSKVSAFYKTKEMIKRHEIEIPGDISVDPRAKIHKDGRIEVAIVMPVTPVQYLVFPYGRQLYMGKPKLAHPGIHIEDEWNPGDDYE